jgi:hypothetical protein
MGFAKHGQAQSNEGPNDISNRPTECEDGLLGDSPCDGARDTHTQGAMHTPPPLRKPTACQPCDRRLDSALQPSTVPPGAEDENPGRSIRSSRLTCAGFAGSLKVLFTQSAYRRSRARWSECGSRTTPGTCRWSGCAAKVPDRCTRPNAKAR